jgi:DNA-binding transcriptional ArsR family regulator
LIKSLLARKDFTLDEVFVYGDLLDHLGPGHKYCFPTQATIGSAVGLSVASVQRAIRKLKKKGLVITRFVGKRNLYYLPDRHKALALLDGQAPSTGGTSAPVELDHPEGASAELDHCEGASSEAPSARGTSESSSITVIDRTNKETTTNEEKDKTNERREDGNEEGGGKATTASPPKPNSFSLTDNVNISSPSSIPGMALASGQSMPSSTDKPEAHEPLASPKAPTASNSASVTKSDSPAESKITSTEQALTIFCSEYQRQLNVKYRVQKTDKRDLTDLIMSDSININDFTYAAQAMFASDYARSRGAGIKILVEHWNEWVLKGQQNAAYPTGYRIVIPRRPDLPDLIKNSKRTVIDKDLPEEHQHLDWNWFPENVRNLIQSELDDGARSIFLYGPAGRGKSSLAAALTIFLRDLNIKEEKLDPRMRLVRFVTMMEFRQLAGDTTFLEVGGPFSNGGKWSGATVGSAFINELTVDPWVLVLDDVIHSNLPQNQIPSIIRMLNHRYSNKQLTIATSNLTPEVLPMRWTDLGLK